MSPAGRDVVVAWPYNDYGQFGRPGEALAAALRRQKLADRVDYVGPQSTSRALVRHTTRDIDGIDVHEVVGRPALGPRAFGHLVLGWRGRDRRTALVLGVGDRSLHLQQAVAPRSAQTVLVAYDKVDVWPGTSDAERTRLADVRSRLVDACDVVVGLSQGAIDDIPSAHYVGHGCDDIWTSARVDEIAEPEDLASIPHPRVVYVGALGVRIEEDALEGLARAGFNVVLIGFGPSERVLKLVDEVDNAHYLGQRPPEKVAGYLLHCDVGIVPHTDEPFTWSMEPHKLYNYSCAGLRSVALNCAVPPALSDFVVTTTNVDPFVHEVEIATQRGRLGPADIEVARSLTWGRVASRIMDVSDQHSNGAS